MSERVALGVFQDGWRNARNVAAHVLTCACHTAGLRVRPTRYAGTPVLVVHDTVAKRHGRVTLRCGGYDMCQDDMCCESEALSDINIIVS